MSYSAAPTQIPSKVHECYRQMAAITPTDNTAIGPFSALYVGGAGNVAVVPLGQTTAVVFDAVPAGTILPLEFQGINATSTTATNLVGLG